ncbi:hypothetical protein SNE40_018761 [Patella caerulea]|uniref:Oxidoreductase-like domain-containing protein n=1 Tax=Patella caerulea TaxID=87958 RepID=A0AAN8J7H9_PATCE
MAAKIPGLITTSKIFAKGIILHVNTCCGVQYTGFLKPIKCYSASVKIPIDETPRHDEETTSDDEDIKTEIKMVIGEDVKLKSATYTTNIVPGKGPPPEPPVECCMSGCSNCVWITYAEELRDYYSDGGKTALKALENIENPSLRAFVKLELNLKS